ncbi:MAG TPA: peptidoglycan editing factor PgeF [Candidatus Omnitrophota bacterium]|nr:peptidoglycan editing factor PgeF [Candidatus Omnitrophota bacterium]
MNLQEQPAGVYRIQSLGQDVTAAFSSRLYDNSKRHEFLAALSLRPENLVMVKQVHGDTVLVADKPDPVFFDTPADGLITKTPRLILGIRTADCVPVFFWDAAGKVAGIAHAGWKGVKAGILDQMLKVFKTRFGSPTANMQVALGPSIRKCCYEVGNEFLGYFPGFYFGKNASHGYLDLAGSIKSRLLKKGIASSQIQDSGLCTVCENKKFFSYRVEHQTRERMLNVICISPEH